MKSETWWRIGVGALLFVGMFWMFYSELKDWQTAIAALLGFGGLIAAVVVSARKQRERDDRIRDQEIQAMARALKSEIFNITLFLKAKTDAIEKFTIKNGLGKKSAIPAGVFEALAPPTTPKFYERCVEKIGFLPDKTSKVVMAYYEFLIATGISVSVIVKAYPNSMDIANAQQIADLYKTLSTTAQAAMASLDQFLEKNGGDAA